MQWFIDCFTHYRILLLQVWIETKTTITDTYLGYLWLILDPLLTMAVFYIVFVYIFHRGTEHYHIFLLLGILSLQFTTKSLSHVTTSLSRSKVFIEKTNLPCSLFITAPILINAFFMLIGFLILAFISPKINFTLLPILPSILLVQLLLIQGLGFFFAILNIYFPDFHKILSPVFRLLMYVSAVFYPPSLVMDSHKLPLWSKQLFICNPLVFFNTAYRDIYLNNKIPDFTYLFTLFILALALIILGSAFFERQKHLFMKIL